MSTDLDKYYYISSPAQLIKLVSLPSSSDEKTEA